MESNHIETKKPKKKLFSVIIALAICLVLGGTATVAFLLSSQNDRVNTDIQVEEKLSPKQTASNEEELRKLLLRSEELTITLTEDVTVDEPLLVNGIKKLTGEHTISMALDAKPYQNILSVLDDAMLTVDGITVDGNGIANCVYVEAQGSLDLLSGKLMYGFPYGVEAGGSVTMQGAIVEHAMCAGMSIVAGGEAHFTNGKIIDSVDSALHVGKGGYASISENARLWGSGEMIITNYGKVEITGGAIGDAHKTLVKNLGELIVQGTADKKVELCDAGRYGIWATKESTLTKIDGLYLHDTGYTGILLAASKNVDIQNSVIENVGRDGIYASSKAEGNVENVTIIAAGTPGINSNTSSKLTAKNLTIEKPGTVGIYAQNGGTIEAENIVVKEPTQRGIMCVGGSVTGKNIEITSPGVFGITCTDKDELQGRVVLENATITNVGTRNGINIVTGGLVRITGGMISGVAKENGAKVNGKDSRLELKNVNIKNCAGDGILTQKDARVVVENATISNCKDGVVGEVDSGTILKNVTVADITYYGVYAKKGSAIKVEEVVVKDSKGRGIVSVGGKVYGKNVEISSAKDFGITCASDGDYKGTVTLENANISDIAKRNGINIVTGGKVTITGGTISGVVKENGAKVNGKDSRLELKNVDIKNCAGDGILTQKDARVVVENATISNCKDGVVGEVDSGTILKNVTVADITYYGVYAKKGSAIKVEEVVVKDSKGRGIVSVGGKVYGKNVEISSAKDFGITCASDGDYKGTVTLENANISDIAKRNGINIVTGGNVQITGGTISDIVTEHGAKIHGENSKLVLKGVDIKDCAMNGILAQVNSEASLTNVKFLDCDGSAIYCDGGTVTGDTVSTEQVSGYGAHCENAGEVAGNVELSNLTIAAGTTGDGLSSMGGSNITVKNGTISNTKGTAVYINRSTVNLTGVIVDSAGSHGVYNNNGTITAADTEIKNSKYCGLYTKGENGTTILNEGEEHNIISGSGENDVYVCGNATATIHNSVFTDSVSHSVLNEVGTVELNGVTIERAGSAGVYLVGQGSKATINNSTIKESKERGIRCEGGIIEGETVDIISPAKYGITCNAKEDTTGSVKLKDVTISNIVNGVYGINVLGASYCEITGGTIDEGKTGIGARAYGENSKLVMTGVDIKNCGTTGVATYKDGEADLTDVTITDSGTHGIQNESGTINGNTVTIENVTTNCINCYAEGAMTINNLIVTGGKGMDVQGTANVTINGGSISKNAGSAVYCKQATVVLNDFAITEPKGSAIYNNNGNVTASDITISKAGGAAVYTKNANGVTTINKVDGENKISDSVKNDVCAENGGTITVNNAKFIGSTEDSVLNKGGNITLNNVTIQDSKQHGIYCQGGILAGNTVYVVNSNDVGIQVEENAQGTLNNVHVSKCKNVAIKCINAKLTVDTLTASECAGALNVEGADAFLKVKDGNFNFVTKCTGVYCKSGAEVVLENVAMVIDNTKTNQVNTIYMNGGKITGTGVTITGKPRSTYSYLTLFNDAETSINGKAYESKGTKASNANTYKYCNNNAVNATEFYTTEQ